MRSLYTYNTLFVLSARSVSAAGDPIVDLGYARYQGVHNSTSGIDAWYGIRYAQAPTGDLRWQTPRDIELKNDYTESVLDATEPGPQCVQGYPDWLLSSPSLQGFSPPPPGSEDCLLLDVMVPANPASSGLPVIVQIHGGGYTLGSSESIVPGNALVYQSQGNLIYVSIQYRLGAYGFLGGAEVAENGALNAGLLDQRAALNWVQRHITKFGGDPAKVTINGGSAGGGSVTNQMILYGGVSNPPFRAALAEYPWWQSYHDELTLYKQYKHVLSASGCDNLSCLRSLPADVLANASQASFVLGYAAGDYGFGDFFYGPSIDGSAIRDLPSQEFQRGHFTKVPLMTNREGYEGLIFSNPLETAAEEIGGLQTLFPNAKQSFFTRLYDLYPLSSFNSTLFHRSQIFGDSIVNCPTYYLSTAVSDSGSAVYKMVFDAGTQLHGSLSAFVKTVNLAGDSNNATLASIVRGYYISFAMTLNPNTYQTAAVPSPYWPVYHPNTTSSFSILNITYTTIDTSPDPDASMQCDFFHGQSSVVRN